VIEAVKAAGLRSTVLTFDPHPRLVLGYEVQLLTTFERRLELIEEAGPDEVLVVEFTQELSRWEPEAFVAEYLTGLGARVVVAGENFRFGAGRRGDVELLRSLGLDVRPVPLVEGVSSSRIRELVRAGDLRAAAELLGRPYELEGEVVYGDQRGGTLPTNPPARTRVPASHLRRGPSSTASRSIGVNPTTAAASGASGVPARLRGPRPEPPAAGSGASP
jgi:riboflavin kinase/FMN adenylyltransferase